MRWTAALFVTLASALPLQAQYFPPPAASPPVPLRDAGLSSAIAEWSALRQSDSYSFAAFARFLMAHPGWPGELAMRRSAERVLQRDGEDTRAVVAYFRQFSPLSAASHLRHAEALDATGRRDEARAAARLAWTTGTLPPEDEARLSARFAGTLTSADHDARMERLLWSRASAAAARQLPLTSPGRRPLYDARLALMTKAPDALMRTSLVDGTSDPGFVIDRTSWLRATGQELAARAFLSQPRRLARPPLDVERWYDTLLSVARAAAADRQWQTAYEIARRVDDAYVADTVVRDRPLSERDDYTSLVWLAGSTAFDKLGRPADAIPLFERYASAARSPQTQSKGLYWAGRAAQAAGQRVAADGFYARAAAFFDQFHGQLAAERLGPGPAIPARATPQLAITAAQRTGFEAREIVRAAQLLGLRGDRVNQTLFLREIAQVVSSDVDHALATELSRRIARPDLAVMIGRSAGVNGHRAQILDGFPAVPVPPEAQSDWTAVHAIARQESQFDRAAVSRAGARGLMQLMPGTARETAGKIGAPYDLDGLTTDTNYNIRLGSWYFARLMDRYGGNHVLAVAAYNAGPGNVNKFIAANGDPRLPGVDVLTWIEAIPLTETRGYVQRVLENAVVYDTLNPRGPRVRSRTPLSAYLGKTTPG